MKTFLSENQRWPFSRFSFFITLEVGDALVLTKRIAGNEIILTQSRTQSLLAEILSAALTKNQKNDFDTILIPNMQRNNFVKFENRQLSIIVISIFIDYS